MSACLAVVVAAVGFILMVIGMTRVMNGWAAWAALVGLGAAYGALALLLGWHSYSGVPYEGYLSGRRDFLITSRKQLSRILLFPLSLLVSALVPIHRSLVARSIGGGIEPDERILDVVFEAVGEGQWVLSDRALYVGSLDGYWRIVFKEIQSVSQAPQGPWARTQVTLSVVKRGGVRHVSGTFTHKRAGRITLAIGKLPNE